MAIKRKVTKDEHGKLSDAEKSHYIEEADGGFRLDLDGDTDSDALKRAKDREVQLRKEAEAALKKAKDDLEALNGDNARKSGDIATLEKSWKEQKDKVEAEKNAEIAKLKQNTERHLIESTAMGLASKISTSTVAIMPHITSRLVVDHSGDHPVVRVLDKNGQVSALSVEDLGTEFVANKDFSGIITASKASGGAGTPTKTPGRAVDTSGKPVLFSKMSTEEYLAYRKANANK